MDLERSSHRHSFRESSTVADLRNQSAWLWPSEWIEKYPMLSTVAFPDVTKQDQVCWKDFDGNFVQFTSKSAWETLRSHAPQVRWYHVIWFSKCIPRHAFIAWLLMNEKLKTHDKMRAWDLNGSNNGPLVCSLCKLQQDSHDHLFFECMYSNQVWHMIKRYITIPGISDKWKIIVERLIPFAQRKVARVMVTKILFSATVYYIWLERNSRLFKGEARDPKKLVDIIHGTVRLKLMSVKFKESQHVRNLKIAWQI
ncbi:uncharacterized protein [Rutidosis leptorrhynchoides]|uniref:uncharacterized protein n=1 Tax=Rutidosis leptorrhynchoides TaxID=125765 RepID=UPI003A99E245